MLKNFFGHIKTILIHKYWVFLYCCKLGIPWQGLTHDLSKFSLVEFKESLRFYQQGKSSPIPVAKSEQGYSLAWQHHKGRNPHHYEYWTDNYDTGITYIQMPYKYVLELIADWLAAGKTYNGKNFTVEQEIDWWNNCKEEKAINDETKLLISYIFDAIREEGFKSVRKMKRNLEDIYQSKVTKYLF